MMITALLFAVRSYSIPRKQLDSNNNTNTSFKQFLLIILCLVFGAEIGFKISMKQLIYILYPCHLMTIVQVSCLAGWSTDNNNYHKL